MTGHTIAHRPPGVSLRTHVLNAHAASIWRLAERREAITTMLFEGRRRVWVTEETAKSERRRSLIDDNPTSG